MSNPHDITDPVRAAVERSSAAATVLEKHKDALFPHLAMLHEAFGPALLRNIVSGAVEAVIIAAQKNGGRVGGGLTAGHGHQDGDGASA